MFCRYCGKKIFDDSVFCSFCGKQLVLEKEAVRNIDPPFKSDPEIVWDLNAFPERKKTEDIIFSWEKDKPETGGAAAEAPESEFAGKIDKFYTFNQKNEEFQKLLDKEYERVRKAEFRVEPEESDEPEELFEPEESDEPEELFEPEESVEKEEPVVASLIFDNEVLAKKFDTNEFNKDLIESALERAGLSAKDYEISQNVQSKDFYESEFKPQFLEDVEADDKEEVSEAEISEADMETIIDETEQLIDENMSITDPQKQEAFKELERLWEAYEQEKKGKSNDRQISESGSAENAASADKKNITREEVFPVKDERKKKGKGKIGKAILTLLLILLMLEISIIAVKGLAPDSAAAAFINDKLSFATKWFDGAGSLTSVDAASNASAGPLADAIKEPEENKAALIAGGLSYNKNINNIEADESLKYEVTKDYADSNISASSPIFDNIWFVDNGEVMYYDRSVVALVIKFNSGWIDYANSGDESIFDFVLEGSFAEKNLREYTKAGRVEKAFNLLKIGEIRQKDNIFYVWTYEEVDDREDDKITGAQNKLIYKIQVNDDIMLISDYIPG